MFTLAKLPGLVGDFILEESEQIKDNITNLDLFPDGYLAANLHEILISAFITFSLSGLAAFIILNWNSYGDSGSVKKEDKIRQLKTHIPKPVILKGLYQESVAEVNAASKQLVPSFQKGQTYWVLLRVQMCEYINFVGTKFELHGNGISPDTTNTKEAFKTKDAYVILRFKITGDIKPDSLVGYVMIHFMNDLNYGNPIRDYITNDFIICAIGTATSVDPLEFKNGLKHIGYENENEVVINKKIPGTDVIIPYSILLPIHQVYDLFMDVYNNCIFESSKYIIDNDNYESWNGKSINELAF